MFQSTLPHGERRTASVRGRRSKRFQSTLPHGERPAIISGPPAAPAVSIHAPARGATRNDSAAPDHGCRFNPRSRTGSDVGQRLGLQGRRVSIHAPARGATRPTASRSGRIAFQSTLPHGERPASRPSLPPGTSFNPRSRTGSDAAESVAASAAAMFQSTLPHGERRCGRSARRRYLRFQSTLPHGERRRPGGYRLRRLEFQSTLPHGERQRILASSPPAEHVSIHAPARGATPRPSPCGGRGSFNPRSRTGSDNRDNGFNPDNSRLFQSTLPHGERPATIAATECLDSSFNPRSRTGSDRPPAAGPPPEPCFNPRSRTGSDLAAHDQYPRRVRVSIHAPARGATSIPAFFVAPSLFQSTLPHGERRRRTARACGCTCFNPRSRTGSDQPPAGQLRAQRSFNPRSRTGSDVLGPCSRRRGGRFQSTLPHGERRSTPAFFVAPSLFQSTLPHGERPRS